MASLHNCITIHNFNNYNVLNIGYSHNQKVQNFKISNLSPVFHSAASKKNGRRLCYQDKADGESTTRNERTDERNDRDDKELNEGEKQY